MPPSKASDEDIFKILEGKNDSNGLNITTGNIPYSVPIPVHINIYIWTIISVSVIGIIGNLLVLMVHLRNVRYMTPFKFLVGHLAFCDCLFSFAQMFNVVANGWCTGKSHKWMLNLQFCKITRGSVQLGSLVSVGTILAITIERFHGITQGMPSNARRNAWKKVLTVVCFIWIVAVISAFPFYVSAKLDNDKCQEEWEEHFGKRWINIYSIYLLLAFCIIPVVSMSLMNGMIICKIKKPGRSKNLYKNMLQDMARLRQRRDLRVIKILLSIIVMFFICVLPIRVMLVVKSFFDPDGLVWTDPWKIIHTAEFSYPFHVAVNPIIYSIIDKAFRNELFKTLFCCKYKTTGRDTYNIISRNNNVLFSFKPCIRERTDDIEASDLLAIPIDFKYPLLFPELSKMTKEEKERFHRETYV